MSKMLAWPQLSGRNRLSARRSSLYAAYFYLNRVFKFKDLPLLLHRKWHTLSRLCNWTQCALVCMIWRLVSINYRELVSVSRVDASNEFPSDQPTKSITRSLDGKTHCLKPK